MTTIKKLATGVATAALAFAVMSAAAHAQETTGGINGTVKGASGSPIANAQVTIVFEPTNQTFTSTTGAGGEFSVRALPPGGPYRVTVAGPDGPIVKEVSSIGLGAAYELEVAPAVAANGATVAEVVVSASRAGPRQVQTGPRSTFNSTDVETLPSFSRDFKDLARLNPFVTLDPSNSNGLIVAGNSYRASTVYIDGVRQSDTFGLNSNAYPTQRSPISEEVIDSVNVEVAPYDVSYGQFTGGVLNLSTKSGSNDYHGTAFFEYDSDHLGAGQEIRDRFVKIPFQDKTYGMSIGGPIWKDRLFFEFGYEKYEGLSTSVLSGPSDGVGVVNQVVGLSSAQVTQIQSILQSRYGFNPGAYGVSQPLVDEKFFGKLTYQINDQHRLVFEAQSTDGQSYTSGSGTTTVALASNGYVLDQALTSYSGYLYSNWTPNFSTELSFTDATVNRTPTTGLAGQPEYDVFLNGATTTGPSVAAGTNLSYQANNLITESKLFRARANYTLNTPFGTHTFLAGYEHEDRDSTDLFVQRANGQYTFTSIANLQAGNAFSLVYANAASNNSADGVVPLNYTIHTSYIQDEWRVLPSLTLRLGLRDEYYEQSAHPAKNAFLQNTFGFDNTSNLDGKNVLQPRFGFNWRPISTLVINGGVGRFSGGSPDVYINNAFNGTGNILGSVTCNAGTANTAACLGALTNVTGVIPANVKAANTASANAGTGVTASLGPNFQPQTVYKASLGAAYTLNFTDFNWTGVVGRYLGDDWRLHADFLYQVTDHGLIERDLDTLASQSGTAPDGRPIYSLTRTTANRYDLILQNTSKGHSENWAIGGGKTFANGIDFDVTYTHTRAFDLNPFTSSVAVSNYRSGGVAYTDINNPAEGISAYSIPYTVKVNFGAEHKFFGDYATRLRVFAQRRGGLPYSYTYQTAFGGNGLDTSGFGLSSASAGAQELVYVPKTDSTGNVTATSDPRVSYMFSGAQTGATVAGIGTQDLAGFNQFLKATGLIKYAGQVAPRDAFNSRDVTTVDLQFTQEIPAFFPTKAKGEIYFSIFNVGNLLNNGWGVLDQYAFPYAYQAIQTTIVNCATGGCVGQAPGQVNQYRYTSYGQSGTRLPTTITTSSGNPPPSTWALKLGVRYKF